MINQYMGVAPSTFQVVYTLWNSLPVDVSFCFGLPKASSMCWMAAASRSQSQKLPPVEKNDNLCNILVPKRKDMHKMLPPPEKLTSPLFKGTNLKGHESSSNHQFSGDMLRGQVPWITISRFNVPPIDSTLQDPFESLKETGFDCVFRRDLGCQSMSKQQPSKKNKYNPPGQIWKESLYSLLVKVARGVFQRCVPKVLKKPEKPGCIGLSNFPEFGKVKLTGGASRVTCWGSLYETNTKNTGVKVILLAESCA